MANKIICPVCKKQLSRINPQHLGSKNHIAALEKAGIHPSEDPALKLQKTIGKKKISDSNIRLANLEKMVQVLQKQQNEILRKLEFLYENLEVSFHSEVKRQLGEDDIILAINKCVQNSENESRWITLNEIISVLKLNREEDRITLNKLLVEMFNKNRIDLAEGGEPKYPLIYQNRIFGMVAIQ